MIEVRVLDVRDGLSVRIADGPCSFVYDCGTHSRSGWRWKDVALDALTEDIWRDGRITTDFAVSHLHSDHFIGFLRGRRIPYVAPDAQVLLPRLPVVVQKPEIAPEFLAKLMALDLLSPGPGLQEIDLVRRMRLHAPDVRPRPLSREDPPVEAGGVSWQCLWPPRRIRVSDHALRGMIAIIEEFDELAQEVEPLRDVLERVRKSETYRELVHAKDEAPFREDLVTSDPVALDDEEEDERGDDLAEGSDVEDSTDSIPTRVAKLNSKFRRQANSFSLVLRSVGGELILFGDATASVVRKSIEDLSADERSVAAAVTPHHGGRGHHPATFDLTPELWVTSCGHYLASGVDKRYDRPRHHRTDRDGPVVILLHGSTVAARKPLGSFSDRWWPGYGWRPSSDFEP